MSKKKKPKKGTKRLRNPFAGQPQTGAGYHSDRKYGKKERDQAKEEIEEELDQEDEAESS